jgi:hypothetical protein
MYYTARAAAVEAIQNKQPLAPMMASLINLRSDPAGSAIAGINEVICLALDAAQRGKLSPAVKNPEAKAIIEAAPYARRVLLFAAWTRADQAAGDALADISAAIYSMRNCLVASFPKPLPPPPPPEREEPRASAEPQILKVEIVGMPERITDTTVTRDGDGNIKRTTQSEFDAT